MEFTRYTKLMLLFLYYIRMNLFIRAQKYWFYNDDIFFCIKTCINYFINVYVSLYFWWKAIKKIYLMNHVIYNMNNRRNANTTCIYSYVQFHYVCSRVDTVYVIIRIYNNNRFCHRIFHIWVYSMKDPLESGFDFILTIYWTSIK